MPAMHGAILIHFQLHGTCASISCMRVFDTCGHSRSVLRHARAIPSYIPHVFRKFRRGNNPNHPNHPNKEAKTNEPDAEDRLAASSGFGRDLAPEQLAL